MKYGIFIISLVFLTACSIGQSMDNESSQISDFDNSADMSYWYQGKAELTSFDLIQSRYGEQREGHAVLVYVTEPFNLEKQVKADNRDKVNSTNVLKLNFTKKFITGVYPYSLMSSTFTPIDRVNYPRTLKVSNSNQDWCGQTFMQVNLNSDKYKIHQYSYFESEGDKELEIDAVLLENEVWNLIRLAPEDLPTGKINIYPSVQYIRLKHKENRIYEAEAFMNRGEEINAYTINYKDRSLSIEFENQPPYEIIGWTEKYLLDDGSSPENLVTRARLKKRIMLDYWNKNSVSDTTWRKELGL